MPMKRTVATDGSETIECSRSSHKRTFLGDDYRCPKCKGFFLAIQKHIEGCDGKQSWKKPEKKTAKKVAKKKSGKK
jgi:hypothetical protein